MNWWWHKQRWELRDEEVISPNLADLFSVRQFVPFYRGFFFFSAHIFIYLFYSVIALGVFGMWFFAMKSAFFAFIKTYLFPLIAYPSHAPGRCVLTISQNWGFFFSVFNKPSSSICRVSLISAECSIEWNSWQPRRNGVRASTLFRLFLNFVSLALENYASR